MSTFGLTSIIVTAKDLETVVQALEVIDTAIQDLPHMSEDTWRHEVEADLTKFRARIATALGAN